MWLRRRRGRSTTTAESRGRSPRSLPRYVDTLLGHPTAPRTPDELAAAGEAGEARLVPHADLSALGPEVWNEVIVDPRGNAYVNAPNFDMSGGFRLAGTCPLDGGVRHVC